MHVGERKYKNEVNICRRGIPYTAKQIVEFCRAEQNHCFEDEKIFSMFLTFYGLLSYNIRILLENGKS